MRTRADWAEDIGEEEIARERTNGSKDLKIIQAKQCKHASPAFMFVWIGPIYSNDCCLNWLTLFDSLRTLTSNKKASRVFLPLLHNPIYTYIYMFITIYLFRSAILPSSIKFTLCVCHTVYPLICSVHSSKLTWQYIQCTCMYEILNRTDQEPTKINSMEAAWMYNVYELHSHAILPQITIWIPKIFAKLCIKICMRESCISNICWFFVNYSNI